MKKLGLSEENKKNLVEVIQVLVKRFSGSVRVQAEMDRMFQAERKPLVPWNAAWWNKHKEFEDQSCRDRFIRELKHQRRMRRRRRRKYDVMSVNDWVAGFVLGGKNKNLSKSPKRRRP